MCRHGAESARLDGEAKGGREQASRRWPSDAEGVATASRDQAERWRRRQKVQAEEDRQRAPCKPHLVVVRGERDGDAVSMTGGVAQ